MAMVRQCRQWWGIVIMGALTVHATARAEAPDVAASDRWPAEPNGQAHGSWSWLSNPDVRRRFDADVAAVRAGGKARDGLLVEAAGFADNDALQLLTDTPGVVAREGGYAMAEAAATGNLRGVVILRAAGVPIDRGVEDGLEGPMYLASQGGNAPVVCYLMAAGVPFGVQAGLRRAPLSNAVIARKPTVVRLLLAAGYRPTPEERRLLESIASRHLDFETLAHLRHQEPDPGVVAEICRPLEVLSESPGRAGP
jgi:hypothetical protein